MNCPQCQTALAPEDVRCARCGLVIGAEQGKQGVATWVWVLVGAGVLLLLVPCGCAALFLVFGSEPYRPGLGATGTRMSSSVASEVPDLDPLTGALRSWVDAHPDAPPARLEDLLGTGADGRQWFARDEFPRDRHGHAYDYRPSTLHDGWRVEVWTLGRDGQAGGTGEDEDERVFESTLTRP